MKLQGTRQSAYLPQVIGTFYIIVSQKHFCDFGAVGI